MPTLPDAPVSDDYFNDLSQQQNPPQPSIESQPKSKRVACVLCRKRKLRCDGARPSCVTCTRLSHECTYQEVRKKSGPKRGYVKELEARLAQVETMLKSQDSVDMAMPSVTGEALPEFGGIDMDETSLMHDMHASHSPLQGSDSAMADMGIPSQPRNEPIMTWESSMMSMGMDEPLPAPEVMTELSNIYFERCHNISPLLHPARFLMQMQHTAPNMRPSLSLQYSVWALAASTSAKYEGLRDHLYRRARHYLDRDEMLGVGERLLNLNTVQAWQCMATYEFKMMYFPRAWLSTGRSTRLAMMMGLHRVDCQAIDVKQCLPPPKDWVEKEERRRIFWMCFTGDRYASIGTGWPMSIDENDIMTHLPASDEAFESGTQEPSVSLKEALEPGGAEKLSIVGANGLISCLFGRNLLHLHRKTDDDDGDMHGQFWKRHRELDGTILNISLGLPEHLRLPAGAHNSNIMFMNMCLHTSTICLHQAAIFKVENYNLPAKLAAESKMRCLTAAAEIASLMKMSSHQDMSKANPFMSFSIYVAARVFVQYLKSRPKDDIAKTSLHFLLSALQAMRRTNPLAESFIAQLDGDMEAAGLEELRSLRARAARRSQQSRQQNCTSIIFDPPEPAAKNRTVFGDMGLAKHLSPNETGRTIPTRPNTTDTSPETLSSTDAEIMELCGSGGRSSTPPTSIQNLSPTGFTPELSTSGSALTFRHSSLDWPQQPTSFLQQPSVQPSPPLQQPLQQPQYQSLPSQQPIQPPPPPLLPLLPTVADFSTYEFSGFDKMASATVLELGAVDETQLFGLSDVEWGQMIGDINGMTDVNDSSSGWIS